MNFDEAITAHSQWKIRLQSFINGTSQENLDPSVVGVDNRCPLGQWIHGEEKAAHSGLREYEDLVKEHAAFHKCAEEVLRTYLSGQADQAKGMLDSGGKFYEASLRTIIAIRHLRAKVQTK